jgi:cytochrome c oxidase subunit II
MNPKIFWLSAVAASLVLPGFEGVYANPVAEEQVIRITAKKFEFSQPEITLEKGVPVVFELTSLDRVHGFNLPDFKTRADVIPGIVSRVRIVPDKTGTFAFFCDVFCGGGHEEMSGIIVVKN